MKVIILSKNSFHKSTGEGQRMRGQYAKHYWLIRQNVQYSPAAARDLAIDYAPAPLVKTAL